ncbi:hypothetical protein ACP4OV_027748 [Aristida adscensionis]
MTTRIAPGVARPLHELSAARQPPTGSRRAAPRRRSPETSHDEAHRARSGREPPQAALGGTNQDATTYVATSTRRFLRS